MSHLDIFQFFSWNYGRRYPVIPHHNYTEGDMSPGRNITRVRIPTDNGDQYADDGSGDTVDIAISKPDPVTRTSTTSTVPMPTPPPKECQTLYQVQDDDQDPDYQYGKDKTTKLEVSNIS